MILTASLINYKYKNNFQASKALSKLAKKWKIIRVNKWIYLTKDYNQEELYIVSNMLVQNSYISLETVLWMNWILTEIINRNYITAITTTNRPRIYNTSVGIFNFRFVQDWLFFVPNSLDIRFATFKMATKEKALIDYIYFKVLSISKDTLKVQKDYVLYLTELRLDLTNIDWELYNSYVSYLNKILVQKKWKYILFKNSLILLYKFRNQISFY